MAYLIFKNNSDNIEGTLINIAKNQDDFDILIKNNTKVIQISDEQFLQIQVCNVTPIKYNSNNVTYIQNDPSFRIKDHLQSYITFTVKNYNTVLLNNPNSFFKDRINNFINLINTYNLDSISYPLNSSFEELLSNNGKTILNILQVQ